MATISFHHAQAAVLGASRQGHKTKQLLMAAGINPQLKSTPHARVNENQMTHLIQQIWDLLEDEFMGFTTTPCKPGAFAFMAQAIHQCGSLRDALKMGFRFYHLFTEDISTKLEENATEALITIQFNNPKLDPEHFYLEFWMIIWHRLASWLTDTHIPLMHTYFTHKKPKHALELNYMFPGQLSFKQSKTALQFSNKYLNLPIVRNTSELKQFLIHSPYDLLTIPGYDNRLRQQINQYLLQLNGLSSQQKSLQTPLEFPNLEAIAQVMNTSRQTLQRKLANEGTSYRQIKEDIRRDLAISKLVQDQASVQDVAYLVGFSEARSFTRAFKLWTGLSPREYCRFI